MTEAIGAFGFSIGGHELRMSVGSATGPHHLKANEPNQDAHAEFFHPRVLAASVADGAGSHSRSREGAIIASGVANRAAAEEIFAHGSPLSAIARGLLEARASVLAQDFWKEAGCTLALFATDGEDFAVAVVGDSFAVLEQNSSGSELLLVQPPSVGEFANITRLLTSKDFTVSVATGALGSLSAVALCSDAFELSTLKDREPTRGFWSNIFGRARREELSVGALIDFMGSQGKIEDDATMFVAALNHRQTSHQTVERTEYSLQELEALIEERVDATLEDL